MRDLLTPPNKGNDKRDDKDKDKNQDKDPKDLREVRFATKPTKGGRCLVGEEGCPCRGVQIDPEGTVLACGCDDAPVIGTVAEGITDRRFLDYPLFTGCHMDTRPAAKQGRARARAS